MAAVFLSNIFISSSRYTASPEALNPIPITIYPNSGAKVGCGLLSVVHSEGSYTQIYWDKEGLTPEENCL